MGAKKRGRKLRKKNKFDVWTKRAEERAAASSPFAILMAGAVELAKQIETAFSDAYLTTTSAVNDIAAALGHTIKDGKLENVEWVKCSGCQTSIPINIGDTWDSNKCKICEGIRELSHAQAKEELEKPVI